MIYDDDFIKNIPEEYEDALKYFVDIYRTFDQPISSGNLIQRYEDYVDAYFVFKAFIKSSGVPFAFSFPELEPDKKENNINIVKSLYKYISKLIDKLEDEKIIPSAEYRFASKMGTVFSYNFTDGDIQKIQEYLNELRSLISSSTLFSDNHRERLLKRLESLQRELHKRMSNIDKFWGLIGEAGVVLGKFGEDAKPFFEIIMKIGKIVWNTQSYAEELPSGTPLPRLD
jgi:hypothetical protein